MSGGGGGGSSTQTVQAYSPEEAARRTRVMDIAGNIYDQSRGMFSQFPGSPPVAPSQETLAAENYLRAVAPMQATNVGALQNAVNFGLGDVLYPESNPALQQTINASIRPITESFVDPGGVMSQIRTGAMQTGQYGGSRQGIAEGIAAGRYAQAIGDASAKVATEGYGRGLDAFGRALALAPQSIAASNIPAQTLATVGQSVEGRAANQAAFEEAQKLWQLNAPWIPLQNYANIVYGGGSSQSTATTQLPKQSSLMGALQGGLAGLQFAGMLGSIPGIAGAGGAGGAALAMSGPIGWGLAGLGALAGLGLF